MAEVKISIPPPENFGKLDGIEEPSTRVEEIKRLLEPIKTQYSKYIELRPWVEFGSISLKVPKKEEVISNMEKNFKLYKGNYLVLVAVFLTFTILTTPWCLLTVLLLAASWAGFLRKNEDPEWQVVLGGVTVNKRQRVMGMGGISGLVVLIFLGSTLSSVIFCSTFLAAIHGVVHKPPEGAVDLALGNDEEDDNV